MVDEKEFQRIAAIDNAIDILLALGSENSKSIRELGQELDIPKSTLHRILQNLEHRGFVKQNGETQKYTLGYAILELSSVLKEKYEIRNIAYPFMESLRNTFMETVQLAVVENNMILIIETIEGTRELRMFSPAGKRYPLTYGNFGKIFLSKMPLEAILQIMDRYPLQKYGSNSITDKDLFIDKVKQVGNEGFSLGIDDPIDGAYSIAVPLWDSRGNIVASLALAGAKTNDAMDKINEIVSAIIKTAEAITVRISNVKA